MNYTRIYDIPVKRTPNFVSFADAKMGVGYKDAWGNIRVRTGRGYIKFHNDGRVFGNTGDDWPSNVLKADEMRNGIEICLNVKGQ